MASKRIIVGMSGGVDSSLTAALLLEEGFEVIGVHLQMAHDVPGSVASGCTASADRQDAIRVAAQLGIRIEVIDAAPAYDEHVLQPFLKSYQQGLTPNPDVWCNEFVKFPLLLAAADRLGIEHVATGHYARTTERGELLRGIDPEKDQSYFLCRLSTEMLQRIRFPLGELKKTEVRERAERLRLSTAAKKDSVGLCFVGDIDVSQFLRERLPQSPGNMVTSSGEIVGRHDGLPFYTLGQRKGIELPNGPWYVVGKRLETNELLVSNVQGDSQLFVSSASVERLHWIGGEPDSFEQIDVQLRYRQPVQSAVMSSSQDGRLLLEFSIPQRAVTPGQEAVLYEGDRVVGCGRVH
ncbi:MAG: tRNA 2-thiouridine(34) synthase MnmA [Candidatus Andersenbacteria bacterium]|nr:tRNA 2-thiouridine(34) synthase MnmA [Candidatus Andersenbacteria bacterium]